MPGARLARGELCAALLSSQRAEGSWRGEVDATLDAMAALARLGR
jgi:hypothetical protein